MNRFKRALRKIRTSLFKGALIHNPVLTQIIGICPLVACCTTLYNGFVLSLCLGVLLIVCEAATSLVFKRFPRWIRIALYSLLSCALLIFARPLLINLLPFGATEGLGIFFYLLSVNALIVIRCEKFACSSALRHSLVDGFSAAIGYGAVACLVGAIREWLIYGTLFVTGPQQKLLPAAALPFTGLLVLGILAACHRALVIRFYPDEPTDTFSLKHCEEASVFGRKKSEPVRKSAAAEDSDDALLLRPRYTDSKEGEDRNDA